MRTLLLTMGLVVALLMDPVTGPSPANAFVTINIGNGSNLNFGRGISCAQGARILRNRGYRNVRERDCRGRYFVYRADIRGRSYEIGVRARDGRVVDYRRLRGGGGRPGRGR
jgi:hypothetical protein